MKNQLNLMIDLETFDVTPDAVVLSIGACWFTAEEIGDTFYAEFDYKSQSDIKKRSVSSSTLDWWKSQCTTIPGDLCADNLTVLKSFEDWILRGGSTSNNCPLFRSPKTPLFFPSIDFCSIWSNGASFDIPMVESLNRDYGVETHWKFWNIRDVRTVVDIMPECRGGQVNNHNALEDAINQTKWIQKFLNKNKQMEEV